MTLRAPVYQRLRLFHVLTAIVPVGTFLIAHFTINLIAVQGRESFNRTADLLSSLPGIGWIECFAIGLPLALHVVLGAFLANAGQALSDVHRYPRPWMPLIHRATGGYLAVYVVFHVWSTRWAPSLRAAHADWFGFMRHQLRNPLIFSFYALAVLAASAHFSLGLMGLGPYRETTRLPGRGRRSGLGITAFVLLSATGLAAMVAFVSHPKP